MESADQDGMTPKENVFEEVRAAFVISTDIEGLMSHYYVDYPACHTVDRDRRRTAPTPCPRVADRSRHKRRAHTVGEA
jgi:hypothetical protein